jgi:diguanylate cyclase (GGDEF)-like protein/PAS domain S-box-containing protein
MTCYLFLQFGAVKLFRSFEAKVRVAFAGAALVVCVLTGMVWQMASDSAQAAAWISHTHDVLRQLERVRSNSVQIELSTQAFRITGDTERLQERDRTVAERAEVMERIQRMTTDNATQQGHWERLRQVVDERLAISRRVEQLRKTEGVEAANAFAAAAPLPESRERLYGVLDAMQQEESRMLAMRVADEAQAYRWMTLSGVAVSLALMAMLGMSYWLIRQQLAETERSRRALAQSERSLATTLRSIGDAVLTVDRAGRVTGMNRVAEQLTGWTREGALGRPVEEVFHIIDERTGMVAEMPVVHVLETGQIQGLANHTCVVARNGTETPISDSAAPITDDNGHISGVVLVFRDETVQRQARTVIRDQYRLMERKVADSTEELRQRDAHLRSLINSVPALIAYIDAGQHYVFTNMQFRRCFSPDQDDLNGRTVHEVLGPARYAMTRPMIEQVLQGRPQSYDWQPVDGLWLAIRYEPRTDENGVVQGYYVLGTDITERRRAEQALRDSEQQLARVLEGADQGYWDWNLQTNEFRVSARWETMLGYEPGEMQVDPDSWPTLVHPEDLPLAMRSIERHVRGELPLHELNFRCRTKSGKWRWIMTRGRIVSRSPDGKPLMMSGTHTDVTERMQLEQAQRQAAVVFDNSYEAIMIANADGLVTKANPAFTRITGYTQEDICGHSPRLISSGLHDAAFFQAFWQALEERDHWHGEVWNRRQNGELFVALQSVNVVRDSNGKVQHYVSVFSDITQLKDHQAELDRVANYDALTGLPNRRLFSDRLRQAIERTRRSQLSMAMCYLDLDGFKAVNDRHGHAAGDSLLVGVAGHIKEVLRAGDTLARLGGDEFVLLLSEVVSAQECSQVVERVLAAVRIPVLVEGQELVISASIGVSLFPEDDVDPDTLMRHADQAMYLAKQAGKNRFQMFDLESDRQVHQRMAHLARVQEALSQGSLLLHYQPKVDLADGSVIGMEALVRWRHPERGVLPPNEFLPQLQGTELESRLGDWVLDSALMQLESWDQAGLELSVSVNISANHLLDAGFFEGLAEILSRHPRIRAARLELEVLETAAILDMPQAVEVLNRCRTLGVSFALDDFGTGYSSLTYLQKLPIHTLKVDQSFVRDMLTNPSDLSIVQGVIGLASAFGRDLIAEGVETMEHGAALRRMGCQKVQGYGISRPMPADEVARWCQGWKEEGRWKAA